jgi:hypothetical protein
MRRTRRQLRSCEATRRPANSAPQSSARPDRLVKRSTADNPTPVRRSGARRTSSTSSDSVTKRSDQIRRDGDALRSAPTQPLMWAMDWNFRWPCRSGTDVLRGARLSAHRPRRMCGSRQRPSNRQATCHTCTFASPRKVPRASAQGAAHQGVILRPLWSSRWPEWSIRDAPLRLCQPAYEPEPIQRRSRRLTSTERRDRRRARSSGPWRRARHPRTAGARSWRPPRSAPRCTSRCTCGAASRWSRPWCCSST